MTFDEEVCAAIEGVLDAQNGLTAHGTWDELDTAVSRLRRTWERAQRSVPPRREKEESRDDSV